MKKSDHQPQHIKNAPGKKRKGLRLTLIIACVLVVAIGVGVVLAYFTDKVHVDTTFTFGNVEIIPDEPDYPPDDPPDTPNEETPKNPLIANNGTEVCIVFMEVKVPVATFTLVNDDRSKGDTVTEEVFWLKTDDLTDEDHQTKFHDTDNGGNWVQLREPEYSADGKYMTYLFGYQLALDGTNERIGNVLNPDWDDIETLEHTEPLFDKVQVKNYLEGTLNGNYSIIVNSYGIQADYLKDADGETYLFGEDGILDEDDLEAGKLTKDILQTIWSIYGTQMS